MTSGEHEAGGGPGASGEVDTPYLTVRRGALDLPIVLSCEHCGVEVPPQLADLGLPPGHLERCPDAGDRGAGGLFEFLVAALHVHGLANRASRFVVDTNRYLDQESLIPGRCQHGPIPGNLRLTRARRQRRIDRYWWPYHRTLIELLEDCERRHGRAFLFSVHTMEAQRGPELRRMDLSLLCRRGCWLADGLAPRLRERGWAVACNEPFHLLRDVVRCAPGAGGERFNRRAVLVEVNARLRRDEDLRRHLAEAILETVAARLRAGR